MTKISIYTIKNCPNCETLKQLLNKENIPYRVVNMFTPEAMTELAMNGIITRSAPVLQIDNNFYTTRELCPDMVDIDIGIVKSIVKDTIS